MHRRTFLATASTAVVTLAGCLENDDPPADPVTPTPDPDEPTPTPEDDGTPTPEQTPTPEEAHDGPTLEEALEFEEEYGIEGEISDPETDSVVRMRGRVHGQNSYQHIEVDEEEIELYHVDGEIYLVMDGQCFVGAEDEAEQIDPDAEAEDWEDEADPDLRATERDTIEGEEMYVFVIEEEDLTTRLYVSVETGYLRRVTFDHGWIDYHSWGDVDEIEPPDMDCIEFDEPADE